MMTRKEMITACVEDQVKRGIVPPESKHHLIKYRLTCSFSMSWSECKRWYDDVQKAQS